MTKSAVRPSLKNDILLPCRFKHRSRILSWRCWPKAISERSSKSDPSELTSHLGEEKLKGRHESDCSLLVSKGHQWKSIFTQKAVSFPQTVARTAGSRASERSPGRASTVTCHFLLQLHFLGGLLGSYYFLNKRIRKPPNGPQAGIRPSQGHAWDVGRPGLFSQRSRYQGLPLPKQSLKSSQPNYLSKHRLQRAINFSFSVKK